MMANQKQATESKAEERGLDSRLNEINGRLVSAAVSMRNSGMGPTAAAKQMEGTMKELFRVSSELARRGKAITKVIPTRGADGSVLCITRIDPHSGAIFGMILRDGERKIGMLLQMEGRDGLRVRNSKNKVKELLARHATWIR